MVVVVDCFAYRLVTATVVGIWVIVVMMVMSDDTTMMVVTVVLVLMMFLRIPLFDRYRGMGQEEWP